MRIFESTLSSILALLGACDHATVHDRPSPAADPVPTVAARTAAADDGGARDSASVPHTTDGRPGNQAATSVPTPAPPRAHPASAAPKKDAGKTTYVCPMHPDVVSDHPGLCPKCNMTLDPKPQVSSAAERRVVWGDWA